MKNTDLKKHWDNLDQATRDKLKSDILAAVKKNHGIKNTVLFMHNFDGVYLHLEFSRSEDRFVAIRNAVLREEIPVEKSAKKSVKKSEKISGENIEKKSTKRSKKSSK